MAIKHKIVINVSDPQGKTANVLKGANVKLTDKTYQVFIRRFHTGVAVSTRSDSGIGWTSMK